MAGKLPEMIVVGRTRFNAGVKVSTAQGAIDRLWERHQKLAGLMDQVREFSHRLPPSLAKKLGDPVRRSR